MQIIAVVVGVALIVGADIAYVRYAAAHSQGRPIPFFFTRLDFVPWKVDLAYYAIVGVGAVLTLFISQLPYGIETAVYVAAVLLPWELMRRRHNRQIMNQARTSVSGSIDHVESVSP
jgi:hypothetical protein